MKINKSYLNKSYFYLLTVMFVFFSCTENEHISLKHNSLTIVNSQNRQIKFNIELASTPEQRNVGLMNREHLNDDNGMLFTFDNPQQVAMWMKNTLIPLDMIFIDQQGVIKKIAKNNRPHDLTPVYSDFLVSAILEINAGLSKSLQIKKGDIVQHEFFTNNSIESNATK